jgi:hypothetical protein
MIILGDIETTLSDNGQAVGVELTVLECKCGFHLGIDSTYIEQVGPITMECPSCGRKIEIPE